MKYFNKTGSIPQSFLEVKFRVSIALYAERCSVILNN